MTDRFFSDPECSRLPESWLLISLDKEDLYIKHALKVVVADSISTSRQTGTGSAVAEQVRQSSANCS